jgi:DMSO/TMAO reductase YedYZ molybdopterin-dependent catalytic subunit
MLATFVAFALVFTLANHWLHLAWSTRPSARAAQKEAPDSEETASEVASKQNLEAPASEATNSRRTISRRTALAAGGVVVLAVAAGGVGIERIISGYFARSNLSYEGMETGDLTPITPTDHFYVVSKNALDPQVELSHWQLEVTGLVNQPKTWSYTQVLALPSETRVVTFECIANGVGGHLISTAEWKGALLQTLLDEAGGVQPGGKYLIFTSVDGYQYSLALADLLEARALVAWQMNGEPLPQHHGFPLRAVVPGRYGEQSPKWLSRIEVVDQPYTGGLYQSQGWSSAQLHTMSRIDRPSGKAQRGAVTVAGIAFAGIRGIRQVEVSADNGQTWSRATLVPPLSDQSWVFWTWLWTPTGPGTYTLMARATDGTGMVQTETQQGTVPAGATGWPQVSVQVG